MAKSQQPTEKDSELDPTPPAEEGAEGAPNAPDQPPEAQLAPERKLVGLAKMGPQVFRMEWLTETGDHQVNHVHRTSLIQTIDAFEDIPPDLPDEDRRHRENMVAEARFKLSILPDETWALEQVAVFAKRIGVAVPRDADAQALLKAIYS